MLVFSQKRKGRKCLFFDLFYARLRSSIVAAATTAIMTIAAAIMSNVSVEMPVPGSTTAEGEAVVWGNVGTTVGVIADVGVLVGDIDVGCAAAGDTPR